MGQIGLKQQMILLLMGTASRSVHFGRRTEQILMDRGSKGWTKVAMFVKDDGNKTYNCH